MKQYSVDEENEARMDQVDEKNTIEQIEWGEMRGRAKSRVDRLLWEAAAAAATENVGGAAAVEKEGHDVGQRKLKEAEGQ